MKKIETSRKYATKRVFYLELERGSRRKEEKSLSAIVYKGMGGSSVVVKHGNSL